MDVKHVNSLRDNYAVVLESAVYKGGRRTEMLQFVDKKAIQKFQRMVWVFAS